MAIEYIPVMQYPRAGMIVFESGPYMGLVGVGQTPVAASQQLIENFRDQLDNDFRISNGRCVPAPIETPGWTDCYASVPPSLTLKIMLVNYMIENEISTAQLARRMGIVRQLSQRIVDFRHVTKLDTLADAFYACGLKLSMKILPIRQAAY